MTNASTLQIRSVIYLITDGPSFHQKNLICKVDRVVKVATFISNPPSQKKNLPSESNHRKKAAQQSGQHMAQHIVSQHNQHLASVTCQGQTLTEI